ncbi:ABC-F family ATP-binding cassette domain-containing protein [Flavobacterium zepuense]|uniref:ABC-F family ATP-binding cassette domain-containing protein n=1 Tax=Flavobacterium zepuense TaxID=2593302 RepID=A0A552V5A3_9FLAO|nr:ABC-F family ATP-binding cassette domain-containing protein [Flavobacterium zepuense]TRW25637.1 ABC-F family ATP-binding cassette domain-containing protein [Flavobacterium zepuense]
MLSLHKITYIHPDKETLFSGLDFVANKGEKIAVVGNNGVGKSTLLKLIAKKLKPSSGTVATNAVTYYVPQILGQYNNATVAHALQVAVKLNALKQILNGNVTETNLEIIGDSWDIEERCREALDFWGLNNITPNTHMALLSGGEQTKVLLAGIVIHQPDMVLLDEPTNHLDRQARTMLYEWIKNTTTTLITVSHDRKLLNMVDRIAEISGNGIANYGGNYEFYLSQKQTESNALQTNIHNKELALKRARNKEREINERQQKLDARGKGKKEKSGVARIMLNTFRNNAENSSAKTKDAHAEKIQEITTELRSLRHDLPGIDKMDFNFKDSELHKGKLLFEANKLNFSYTSTNIWHNNIDFKITSGGRIALQGNNGSGKSTLIKLLTGHLLPTTGTLYSATKNIVYVDQDYSYLNNALTVFEQAQKANTSNLTEHEVRMLLARFLFPQSSIYKLCSTLSGGERMRLVLCCITMFDMPLDVLVLDEPTNNLDLQNIQILTTAVNQFKGTLIAVSHDQVFLDSININSTIML